MGVGRSVRSVAFWLAFLALLTGVMGESLDTDLVGIVVAAVCIAILLIVLFSFLTYCCFRGVEFDRDSVIRRKDSGSVSTSNGPPRWTAPPSSSSSRGPLYNVATDPVLYAMPSVAGGGGNYFLRQHPSHSAAAAKLRESDRLKQIRQAQEREEFRLQETIYAQPITTSQPNGHVVQDLPSSGVNYRVVHKHETGESKAPRWTQKSYVETEKSLEIQEEDDEEEAISAISSSGKPSSAMMPAAVASMSIAAPHPPHQPQPKPQPQPQLSQPQGPPRGGGGGAAAEPRGVRAEVSPKHSNLDSRDVLHVSEEFTIIDFVDPLQQQQQQQHQQQQQQQQQRGEQPRYSYRAYVDRDFRRPTEITRYSVAPKRQHHQGSGGAFLLADTSHGSSGIGYVPPVSTSTPRSPSSDHEMEDQAAQEQEEENERPRMRKPKEGSVRILPAVAKGRHQYHQHQYQHSGGYKGDFML